MSNNEDRCPADPQLRFPEFRNDAPWQAYLLEKLEELHWVELGRGDVISKQDIEAIPGDFPIYSSSVKNNGYMGSYGRYMFDEELISWSVDGGGDFFHRPRHKFSVTNVSGFMRLDTGHLNYRFTASHLQSLHAKLKFDYQLKAHPSVIRKLYRLHVPALAEQQKIAECLSSLDEMVAAQGRKVEAIKTHKRGLIQQLFPRDPETQPARRFPEFRETTEWAPRVLGSFLTERSTKAERAVPLYSLTIDNGVTAKTERYEREFLVTNKEDAYKLVLPDDFAFNPMNLRFGAIGRHVGSQPVALSKYYNIFFSDDSVDSRFCETYFRSDQMVAYYDLMATGTLIEKRRVHFDRFLKFNILFPKLEEQHRIAECLSSLDAEIAAETEKLVALKTHKQGLMQQLFPVAEGA